MTVKGLIEIYERRISDMYDIEIKNIKDSLRALRRLTKAAEKGELGALKKRLGEANAKRDMLYQVISDLEGLY